MTAVSIRDEHSQRGGHAPIARGVVSAHFGVLVVAAIVRRWALRDRADNPSARRSVCFFQEPLRAPETALGPVHFKGFLATKQRRDSERMGLNVQTLIHVDNGMFAMVLGRDG